MNTNKKKFKYIYNPKQAKFYIDNGLQLIQTGTNGKTGNKFWVFLNGIALYSVHNLWMSLKDIQ